MNFYLDPAFFLLLVPVVAVAAALGVNGRSLRGWGCAASLVMLALLFARDTAALAYVAVYLAATVALALGVLRLFRGSDGTVVRPCPHAVGLYRAALALQVAPLVAYKVGVLVDPNALGFLGISYITFKAVQVLIEIRDGLIERLRPLDLLYFLSFFPTFTSGPILRSRAFGEQAGRRLSRDAYLELLYRGAGWFALGALYKFVGAPLAQWALWFAPSAIGTATPGSFALAQLAYAFAYGLDLFFDFAGYSAMAVGLGCALGIEVPRNFRAPFLAIDIKDFWNRWHMTLSYWLRDFVFMRFTSAALKRKLFGTTLSCACVAFVLEFLLMGLWHGITLDYAVYGLYHGLLLAGCEVLQKKWAFYKRHKKQRWFKLCSWAVTMACVFFGFALFSGQVFHPVVL